MAAAAPLTQVQGVTEPIAEDITNLQYTVSDNYEPALTTAATHTDFPRQIELKFP